MSYQLRFDEQALKQLQKLPTQISSRIVKKLQVSKQRPQRFFKRLKQLPYYRLRVGEYRVIADIHDQTIDVLYVDHRSNVYKRF